MHVYQKWTTDCIAVTLQLRRTVSISQKNYLRTGVPQIMLIFSRKTFERPHDSITGFLERPPLVSSRLSVQNKAYWKPALPETANAAPTTLALPEK